MLVAIGSMIGGLGLFLLAVKMITDGLRLAAGNALRDLLARSTATPLRGVTSGISITAIVQSSSAVTVATIGFVNAGLLNLYQAMGVVYGANVGTTVTGWLVAAVGFKINVEAFALPLIGLGMLLRLTGAGHRRGALGEALAGFGLFFIGVDILRGAFETAAASMQIPEAASMSVGGVAVLVGIGFLMTVLTQSSSAAIALILTAATGGVISLANAAAMVIGANVGTTSTAAFASIGATPNAKRVAGAHIAFNLLTGIVALLLLPLMLWLVNLIGKLLGLADAPAVALALFHTVFNVLGVLLMWPLTARLSTFLEHRFRSVEEIEGKPKYLDKNVAVSPFLALDAVNLELSRVNDILRRLVVTIFSAEKGRARQLARDAATGNKLIEAVGTFVTELEQVKLPPEMAGTIARILRTVQYYNQATALAVQIAGDRAGMARIEDPELSRLREDYRNRLLELADAADLNRADFQLKHCRQLHEQAESDYQQLKAGLLQAGAHKRMRLTEMTDWLEWYSLVRRMISQFMKGLSSVEVLRRPPPDVSASQTNNKGMVDADKKDLRQDSTIDH